MIDIIIPMYNCEDTIEKTLLSICMQKNTEMLKVILVDDASDCTYDEIIEKYRNILDIKYIRQNTNNGAGLSRQIGIENSNNEYLLFMDSDDIFYSCDSISVLYNKIILGYDYVDSIVFDEYSKRDYSNPSDLHGKLYKRSFIEKNNIRFNDTRYHEDNSFNNIVLINNPKYITCDEVTYVYCYNKKSLTKNEEAKEWERLNIYIQNMRYVLNETRKNKCDEILINKYVKNKYNYLKNFSSRLDEEKQKILNEWLVQYGFEKI